MYGSQITGKKQPDALAEGSSSFECEKLSRQKIQISHIAQQDSGFEMTLGFTIANKNFVELEWQTEKNFHIFLYFT